MGFPATYRRERLQKLVSAVEKHAKWVESVSDTVFTRDFRLGVLSGMQFVLSLIRTELGIMYDESLFESKDSVAGPLSGASCRVLEG